MTRQMSTLIVTLTVAVTLLLVVSLQGQPAPAAAPTRVAVVDVQKIFRSMDEQSGVNAELTQQAERLQREEQEKVSAVKSRQADADLLSKESDAYRQALGDIERMTIELQVWRQFMQRKLEQERTLRVQDLYNKILGGIDRLAQREGYDLVLQKDTQDFRPENQQQLTAMILGRKVLYASDKLDITDAVTQMLNNEFNNRARTAPAPGQAK